nr:MAG TPA: hypothetical protein [Caudoviricetes sp.]
MSSPRRHLAPKRGALEFTQPRSTWLATGRELTHKSERLDDRERVFLYSVSFSPATYRPLVNR